MALLCQLRWHFLRMILILVVDMVQQKRASRLLPPWCVTVSPHGARGRHEEERPVEDPAPAACHLLDVVCGTHVLHPGVCPYSHVFAGPNMMLWQSLPIKAQSFGTVCLCLWNLRTHPHILDFRAQSCDSCLSVLHLPECH